MLGSPMINSYRDDNKGPDLVKGKGDCGDVMEGCADKVMRIPKKNKKNRCRLRSV